jgi:predicted dehydrogenase
MSSTNEQVPHAAIVGAGVMGSCHADAAVRAGAQVVAVVDLARGRGDALAARHPGARSFTAFEDCLTAGGVDVVHVCTPLGGHYALIEAALTAKHHVLAEKPLCGSLAETEAALELASRRGLTLCPVHQFPFQRGFLGLLERRERLGELVRVEYRTCSAGAEGKDPAARRALLLEILPHPVSLFHGLLGEVDPAAFEVIEAGDDDLKLTGCLAGVRVAVDISLRGRPPRNELLVIGTAGTATVDLFHGFAVFEGGRVSGLDKALRPFRFGTGLVVGAGVNLARRALQREPKYPGLRGLVSHFYKAVATGGAAPVGTAETLAVARLLDVVRAHAESGPTGPTVGA